MICVYLWLLCSIPLIYVFTTTPTHHIVLITVVNRKSWNWVDWFFPLLFFYFKIVLSILVPLPFQKISVKNLYISTKHLAGILIKLHLTYMSFWGKNQHLFYVESSSPWTSYTFPFILVFFDPFHQHCTVFSM